MIGQLLALAALLLAAIAVTLGVSSYRRSRRELRRFCASTPDRWWAHLIPWRWVWRPICGYDLTGLPTETQCPECGATTVASRCARSPSPFRRLGAAAVAALGAAVCLISAGTTTASWAGAAPTIALIPLERHLPTRFAKRARWELDRRIQGKMVLSLEARILSRLLIADLGDDRQTMNGSRAAIRLSQLWPHSRPALEGALASPDWQARLLAAQVLRGHVQSDPSEALLRASLNDLADGPALADSYLKYYNATNATAFFVRLPDKSRPYLIEAMRDGDPQQKLLGAAIAGACGMGDLAPLAVPVLIDHLGDNSIEGDARLAAPSLLAFGDQAADQLEMHRHDPDWNRRQLCRAILARLGRPTDPRQPSLDRAPPVTNVFRDPLDEPLLGGGEIRVYFPTTR